MKKRGDLRREKYADSKNTRERKRTLQFFSTLINRSFLAWVASDFLAFRAAAVVVVPSVIKQAANGIIAVVSLRRHAHHKMRPLKDRRPRRRVKKNRGIFPVKNVKRERE